MTQAIFLSYASQDADAARRICDALRTQGLEVWFDQSELRGGDAWDASIRKQIKDCVLFVPIISANTNAREEGYFRLEWKLAVDRSHLMADNKAFFVPVLIGDVNEPTALVPDAFRARQWSRLNDESAFAAFAGRIGKLLAGSASPGKNGSNGSPVREFGNIEVPNTNTPQTVALAGVGKPAGAQVSPPSRERSNLDADAVANPSRDDGLKSTGAHAATPSTKDATPSIAVLAFANRSASADDEYFSDGLADELLTVLAKVKGLRVAARTSAFSFKGKQTTVGEIGRALNVATVLEGSVRKSGNRVRISVQLIKAQDGFQLWGETYDRTLNDIFAVQDDIAQSVVTELRTTLLGALTVSAKDESISIEIANASADRSGNIEAQRLFVQGRFLLARKSEVDLKQSLEYFQQAVLLDPGFALGWAFLAQARSDASGWGIVPVHDANTAALSAAGRALQLNPDLVHAHLAMANIQMGYQWDWRAAEDSIQRALQLSPDHADVLTMATKLSFCLRRFDAAEAFGLRAVALDPLNAPCHRFLAMVRFSAGSLDAARESLRQSMELSPDSIATRHLLAQVLSAQGRYEEALAEAMQEKAEWARLTALSIIKWAMGSDTDRRESDAVRATMIEKHGSHSAIQISHLYSIRGDADGAFLWLERAYTQRDAGLAYVIAVSYFDSIKHDPRWAVFVKKMGFDG